MFRKIFFWLKFLWICISKPFALLKNINAKNLSILLNATRNESPRVILSNLRDLLLIGPKSQETKKLDLLCDVITSTATNLEIIGWAFSKDEIDRIEIYGDDAFLGLANYGAARPDVYQEAKDRIVTENVGFDFSTREKNYKIIRIDAIDKKGKTVSIYRKSLEFSIEDQYQMILDKEKSNRNKRYIPIPNKISTAICLYDLSDEDTFSIKEIRKTLQSTRTSFHPNCTVLLLSTLDRHQNEFEQRINEGTSLRLCRLDNFKASIKETNCDYVLFLEVGDELTEISLHKTQRVIQKEKPDFIYFDEEQWLPNKELPFPLFKPSFDFDLLTSYNYIGSSAIVNVKKGNELNWFEDNIGRDINLYQFFLKFLSKTNKVSNISDVLLKRYKDNEAFTNRKALEHFIATNSISATIEEGKVLGTYRLVRIIGHKKKLTIVIPFKDNVEILQQCVKSILDKTLYDNFEILLISNNSVEQETFDYLNKISLKDDRVKWKACDIPFNFSKINNWAVKQCNSEYILFMNNDVVVINEGWMRAMVEHIQREKVGAVGAKLLYPDNSIQHAGVIVGIYGVAAHGHKHFDTNESGYMNRINVIQRFSSCTAACLLVKKALFDKVGGFEEALKVNFNDVDLCLKFKEEGYQIIYTPYAEAYHYESKTRITDSPYLEEEIAFIKDKWKVFLEKGDPHYSPNLTLQKRDFSLRV